MKADESSNIVLWTKGVTAVLLGLEELERWCHGFGICSERGYKSTMFVWPMYTEAELTMGGLSRNKFNKMCIMSAV